MTAMYTCCDERRRLELVNSTLLNGIDFLEVGDLGTTPDLAQRQLRVHFVTALNVNTLTATNIRIAGGERIVDVSVAGVATSSTEPNVLVVDTSEAGDFSPYVLRLVQDQHDDSPPPWVDPILSAIQFSFKVGCPTDLDCRSDLACAVETPEPPPISYLAKDYSSFRQLMLDRLSVLVPGWQERSPADVGVVLVELLAYVGDRLSYQQDAVSTEAYLDTARRRISVRRHARLVDYWMHDGCNARVWAQIALSANLSSGVTSVALPKGTQLLTAVPAVDPVIPLHPHGWTSDTDRSPQYRAAVNELPEIFETMHDATIRPELADLRFYTWGARECCLPEGSISATLLGAYPNLAVGDVLVLAEQLGPETGSPADADPAHRHAVRLTDVSPTSQDPLGGRFDTPPTDSPVDVTGISWHPDDALPFPLCISARIDTGYLSDVSHALGNIVLADHGVSVTGEALGTVPDPTLFFPEHRTNGSCSPLERDAVPPRYRPIPAQGPITQAAPYDAAHPPASATATMTWLTSDAAPVIGLHGDFLGTRSEWKPVADLLDSFPGSTEFALEVEEDGTAEIRFGDDRFGTRPASRTVFTAGYRVGNGVLGNVGAGSLAHVATDVADIGGVTNPLPAVGGVDPESSEDVRQNAPAAFRTQERAVTLDDYGQVAGRYPTVQRAAATLRWTGSWRTVFVSADRLGNAVVDDPFRAALESFLDIYRMAGQDLDVDQPRYVSLELELFVCVKRDYFTADVEAALRRVLSNRSLPDGTRGLFHPDNFTFGQPVYLSPIVAAAQAVPGVDDVEVRRFRRLGTPRTDASASGVLQLAHLEIARLNQDPDFPEHGRLVLDFGGGE